MAAEDPVRAAKAYEDIAEAIENAMNASMEAAEAAQNATDTVSSGHSWSCVV